MLNYKEMFEPFTADGCTLEMMIDWVQKKTNANASIMNQGVAELMDMVSKGNKFPLPCPCGCPGTNVHTPINHALLSIVADMLIVTSNSAAKVIEDRQKLLLESQMKQLSTFDKEYDKMINGTWSQRNLPTFVKLKNWLGAK